MLYCEVCHTVVAQIDNTLLSSYSMRRAQVLTWCCGLSCHVICLSPTRHLASSRSSSQTEIHHTLLSTDGKCRVQVLTLCCVVL